MEHHYSVNEGTKIRKGAVYFTPSQLRTDDKKDFVDALTSALFSRALI